MAVTANTALRDAMIRHQIQLQRLSAGLSAKITKLLNDAEADLAKQIRAKLKASEGIDSPADVRRLNNLITKINAMRADTFEKIEALWQSELQALALAEPGFFANMLDTTSPVLLDLALPDVKTLKAIVRSKPFEGRTLKGWAQTLADADIARIDSQIRLGMGAGEDVDTIARRIVGSARMAGTDGVTQITRQGADAITRTAVNYIANEARREVIMANTDILSEEVYHATLDSRTTRLCSSLDGNIYAVGKGPRPPLHFRCRSTRIPVFNSTVLGNRPMKASTEQQLLREYNKANGVSSSSRDDLPLGHKGKFDAFSRKRVRELTGTVPASTTYQEWLETQSKEFQNDVLGPTRAKLFRDGGLTLDKFVNRQGDEITLAELARKQADAFRAAGLDPGDF